MMAELVSVSTGRLPGVAEIALSDPERLNPIGPAMLDALTAALDTSDADEAVRCSVIVGRGRAFSAGGEMSGVIAESAEGWHEFYSQFDAAMDRVHRARKPVIAAVGGMCYGAGMMLAAHCDLVVASSAARFGLIESRMGSPAAGVFPFLIGSQWAKFLALTGEIISAATAQEIGFVLEVIDEERFAERVDALAARVAAMPAAGVRFNKLSIDGTLDMMGWGQSHSHTRGLKAVLQSTAGEARAADGTVLREVLQSDGLRAFIAARDAAFREPWLERDQAGAIERPEVRS